MDPKICIVIPCKDEEATVERTLASLSAQKPAPSKIILVDDGSTDDTSRIVEDFATRNPQLEIVRRDPTARDTGQGIAFAVREGLSRVDCDAYDYIGKFDADLEFPSDYFGRILTEFDRNPSAGLIGGVCAVSRGDRWEVERITNDDHVRGALKLYRATALKSIGGIAPITGWDTLDEYKLRYRGYGIIVLSDLIVKQFRPTNQATDKRRMAGKLGETLYNIGSSLDVLAVSAVKRSLTGGGYSLLDILRGYCTARRTGATRYITLAEAAAANDYRRRGYAKKALFLLRRYFNPSSS